MPSPDPRPTDEMYALVTRQAAHRLRRRARQRRALRLSAVAVVVVGLLGTAAFVRAGGGGRPQFTTVGARIDSGGGDALVATDADTGAGGGSSARTRGDLADDDRQVVSTGSITVQVDDVRSAAADATAIATDAGGYVSKSETALAGDQRVSLTLRVPADDFTSTMARAAKLGEVQKSTTNSDDVTDEVADLEGRLKTARVSADRLRELLVDAENVQNIITINDRLAALETEIENLTRALETVEDRVEYATVTVHLVEDAPPAEVSDDLPGPLNALRSGLVAFVNVAKAALAAVAFALPFLLVALLAWWIVRRWRHRHLG